MPELDKTAGFEAARDQLDNLVRSLASELGPQRFDADGDPTGEPIPDVMLSQWVLVSAWIDPADGECYIVRCNPNTPTYQITGLLTEALDE